MRHHRVVTRTSPCLVGNGVRDGRTVPRGAARCIKPTPAVPTSDCAPVGHRVITGRSPCLVRGRVLLCGRASVPPSRAPRMARGCRQEDAPRGPSAPSTARTGPHTAQWRPTRSVGIAPVFGRASTVADRLFGSLLRDRPTRPIAGSERRRSTAITTRWCHSVRLAPQGGPTLRAAFPGGSGHPKSGSSAAWFCRPQVETSGNPALRVIPSPTPPCGAARPAMANL